MTLPCLISRQLRGRSWVWLWALLAAALALPSAACGGDGGTPVTTQGDRTTVSVALLENAGRRAALYAIEQGIVTSDTVDLDLTFLPLSTLAQAVPARQYDVIEATPLTVPEGAARDLELVVLSAGVQDLDGTFLFAEEDSGLAGPGDLNGKVIGVVSLEDISTLEIRYLLHEAHGLDTSTTGGDVTFYASPAESLPTELQEGRVAAAVMLGLGAFRLLEDDGFRVVSRVTEEMRELTGAPIMSSILVTYPGVAHQKADALRELNRMLAESVTYFKVNQDDVIEAVAADQEADPDFLRWWWEHQDLLLGDLSAEVQERLLDVWEAALAVGDIEGYPELASVLFNPEAMTPASGQ